MTQVNTGLKRVFTVFNIFFAIIGALIFSLTLLSHLALSIHEEFEFHQELLMLYVVGTLTLVIAILGAYGAHKERLVPLIIFLVCMVMGSLKMLNDGITMAAARPQLKNVLEQRFQAVLPLDRASSDDQNEMNLVQSELHCCGLYSYNDWSGNFPGSCVCSPEEQEQGLCQTATYKDFGQKNVYAEPCFPMILHYIQLLLDIVLGVVFSLLALALLGMILSSIIIHQMRYPTPRLQMRGTVPPIFFTATPPKYQELHNPPTY